MASLLIDLKACCMGIFLDIDDFGSDIDGLVEYFDGFESFIDGMVEYIDDFANEFNHSAF